MSKLKLLSLPVRRWSRPGWCGIEGWHQHAELGKFLIVTYVEEGAGADAFQLQYHFRWVQWRNRVDREHAQQQQGKGKPKQPPAAPQAAGRAA